MENILTILCGISALFLVILGGYGLREKHENKYDKEAVVLMMLGIALAVVAVII